jgi:hypothetical protein
MESESYEAHWRTAQNDAVPYSKDFPEVVTLAVELLNGGKNPTVIDLHLNMVGDHVHLNYQDDGGGCSFAEAQERLFHWAALQSVNGKSMYGHGTKKFLAKCNDYNKIEFAIRSRIAGERKINEWVGPYRGTLTKHDIKTSEDYPDFPEHGFELEVKIPIDRFQDLKSPKAIFSALKELICSRKSQETLTKVEFCVTVQQGETMECEDSKTHGWKSLQETIATHPRCRHLLHKEEPLYAGVTMVFDSYTTGDLEQIEGFPVYGRMGGGTSTRVHCANEDTMIEAISWYDIHPLKVHPSHWHRIDFVRFVPDSSADVSKLPQPATTKVQYRHESPEWKAAVAAQNKIYKENAEALKLPSKKDLKATPPAEPSGSSSPSTSSDPVGQAPPVSENPETIFDDAMMNDYFLQLRGLGKSPQRYSLPKWYSCEDLIVFKEGGLTQLITYRKRQRGELDEDLEKAHTALAHFANRSGLKKEQIHMTFFLNLKGKKAEERITEFKEKAHKMSPTIYPLIERISFRPISA